MSGFKGLLLLPLVGMVALGAVRLPSPPLLFPSEPLVITLPGGPPQVFHGRQPFPLSWRGTPTSQGTEWRGVFPEDAPLGLWTLRWDGGCYSFLRVPAGSSILVVKGVPGTSCGLDGEERICGESGLAWFVASPGTHVLEGHLGRLSFRREVELRAGERREVALAWVELVPTAPAALPGRDFLVSLRILSPVDLPTFTVKASLPPGWSYRIRGPCAEDLPCPQPIFAGVPREVPVILSVPAGAMGDYRLSFTFPELNSTRELHLSVRKCLDPLDVVRHWDVEAGDVDLSRPGEVTYQRLLWAISQRGKVIPYACRPLGDEDIKELSREWQREQ